MCNTPLPCGVYACTAVMQSSADVRATTAARACSPGSVDVDPDTTDVDVKSVCILLGGRTTVF